MRDGRQLFYRTGRQIHAVDVEAGSDASVFRVGNPRMVLDDLDRSRMTSSYDISPSGDAVLVPMSMQDVTPPDRITVLLNWLDEVERQAPPGP